MQGNTVAKHAFKFNRCKVYKDRKRAVKAGYTKHKSSYQTRQP